MHPDLSQLAGRTRQSGSISPLAVFVASGGERRWCVAVPCTCSERPADGGTAGRSLVDYCTADGQPESRGLVAAKWSARRCTPTNWAVGGVIGASGVGGDAAVSRGARGGGPGWISRCLCD